MTTSDTQSSSSEQPPIEQLIAQELNVTPSQIWSAIKLLDSGSTVPFIARYRKEATGGLTDIHLRLLAERLEYLRELEHRRESILHSVEKLGKLHPDLKKLIQSASTKKELEDLYLPYKTKKTSKAQSAKNAGLEPLALSLLSHPELLPEEEAKKFLSPIKGIKNIKEALDGSREILMELFYEDAPLIKIIRDKFWEEAWLTSKSSGLEDSEISKFADYFSYSERVQDIPSHRMLAILRGRKEKQLHVSLDITGFSEYSNDENSSSQEYISLIMDKFGIRDLKRSSDAWLIECVQIAWRRKIRIRIDIDIMTELANKAEAEAIKVFSENLNNLLLAAPGGPKAVLGLDPGFRTGVKVVAIDEIGQVKKTVTIYPHPPQREWDLALEVISLLIERYNIQIIAIGNGTASRETDKLVTQALKKIDNSDIAKIIVSEAGASVYSASEYASKEFPNMDVSMRGAVSIARRVQDPLAELVKIDPKSIGVGQYQHDVNQVKLGKMLSNVVEDCVNAVGVNANTASKALLSYVSGLTTKAAESLVTYREKNGPFKNRLELKKIPEMGPKTFEQAAGFLKIQGGDNPLDGSSVHPESYSIVEDILKRTQKDLDFVLGNAEFLSSIKPADFLNDAFGIPTINDVLSELEKPGRDPRPEFRTARLKEGVETVGDLKPGLVLEGTITNVTNFGAFIDIGVHQDGLVHISEMGNTYIQNPAEYFKVGQIVRVKVLEIDKHRNRISLTMRQKSDADRKKENITPIWR